MNFVYDILINFNENLYDFYEWNLSDNVMHIRKIPLFRVSTDVLEKIKDFNLKFDLKILDKIENKCERFTTRDVETINYAALFSDCNDVIAVKFNKDGINFQMSKLLVDESEEVLEVCERCNEFKFDYEVLNEKKKNVFKTRMQMEKINYLLKSLNRLEQKHDNEKLKYLYFECFDEKEDKISTVIKKLKNAIDNEKLEKIMYDFFKLISIN